MRPVPLKVARIGNSRGVRLPAGTLERYGIGDEVIMEERSDGILLRLPGPTTSKLSWAETASAMAGESQDWNAWETTTADALEGLPWAFPAPRRVAEESGGYEGRSRKRRP